MSSHIQRTVFSDEEARRRESFRLGYHPPDKLQVDPSVQFYPEDDAELDVITYEIIRSKLWNLNLDHSDTVRRTSGSNIVVEGYDLTSAIATAHGDVVTFSPYTMFFAGTTDSVIKWTLEHRSMNVGIGKGDVFIQDDPWVGTNHQFDTAVYAPLFVGDKLFGWLYNCVHQREIGGRLPGGFDADATDCYSEPSFMPPTKIVEGGKLREDMVDLWIRRSRLPELLALEVRSQLAGIAAATRRLDEVMSRYGPGAVHSTMHRMIDNSAHIIGERLRSLPEATWRDERYIAGASNMDNGIYKLAMSFRKQGDRIIASNAGSDPSVGVLNTPRGMFRAAVMAGLLPVLAFDQYLCAAGLLRQLDFEYAPGTINTAEHPASVASSIGSVSTTNQAHVLASKMVSGSAELSEHAFASSTIHTLSSTGMAWTEPNGSFNMDGFGDLLSGGIGGFNHRDGMDYGGSVLAVAHRFSDVERFELSMPMLYLYRRELPWAGGHGQWRGGANYVAAYAGLLPKDAYVFAGGLRQSVSMGLGVCGGFPATGGYFWSATGTDLSNWFDEGRIPSGPDELRQLSGISSYGAVGRQSRLCMGDVFEYLANPGAGWGDPIDRDPARVALDVREGRTRPGEVEDIYGVVLTQGGEPDVSATATRRERLRQHRLLSAAAPRMSGPKQRGNIAGADRVIEGVAHISGPGGGKFACASCGQILSESGAPYRLGCSELTFELPSISELFLSPLEEVGQDVILRGYMCPQCARVIDTQICLRHDSPYIDVVATR